jgi:hypothetical protein
MAAVEPLAGTAGCEEARLWMPSPARPRPASPEQLCFLETLILHQVLAVVVSQFIMAFLVRDWAWWKVWVAAYVVSGTLNQNLFCAQHEISHFLAFRKPAYNKLLALFGNLPLVVPVAVKFREYHHDHHIFLVSSTGAMTAAVWCSKGVVREAAGGTLQSGGH